MAIRMAQYGTRHAHAAGKLRALRTNPHVELVGVYEPDVERQHEVLVTDAIYAGIHWFAQEEELLADSTITAVAAEDLNSRSLAQVERLMAAGKHVWYDKPAGEDWAQFQRVMAAAQERGLLVQMGYMFRYHDGFRTIADWAKSGFLGRVFAIRAHMSTNISAGQRQIIAAHRGGIFYDLSAHMLDLIVWILGRPQQVTSFLHHDDDVVPGLVDNAIGVFEYEHVLALVDIAAMEPPPLARRFEVYGTRGSAILLEPFEPAHHIRLCLAQPSAGWHEGEQLVPLALQTRQDLYDLELEAFLATVAGHRPPQRSAAHELLVQETLLRATGALHLPGDVQTQRGND